MATLATETWTGTTGAAWPSQWTTFTGTAGTCTIQANAGRLQGGTTAYTTGARAYLNAVSTANFDILVDVSFSDVTKEQYLVLGGRFGTPTGVGSSFAGYYVQLYPANSGGLTGGVNKTVGTTETGLSGDIAFGTWTNNTAKRLRFQMIGTAIKVKVWDPASAEPGTWLWTGTDSSITAAGRIDFHHSPGFSVTTNPYVTLDNLTVTDGASTSTTTTTGAASVDVASSASATTTRVYTTTAAVSLNAATSATAAAYASAAAASINVATTATARISSVSTTGAVAANVQASATAFTSSVATTGQATANVALTATSRVSTTGTATVTVTVSALAQQIMPATTGGVTVNVAASGAIRTQPPAQGPLSPFVIKVWKNAFSAIGTIADPVEVVVTPRWPELSTAEITMRTQDFQNVWLQNPGSKITVLYNGEIIFSGPMVAYHGDFTPFGTTTYTFEGDFRILDNALSWPLPRQPIQPTSSSPGGQGSVDIAGEGGNTPKGTFVFYDGYSGGHTYLTAESAMKWLIREQVLNRLGFGVTIETDSGRGGNIQLNPIWGGDLNNYVRMQPVGEIIRMMGSIASGYGAVLDIRPSTTTGYDYLVTYRPVKLFNRPLTFEGGGLVSGTFSYQAPDATQIIVGGPGEGPGRIFYRLGDVSGRETDWGYRAEVFVDGASDAKPQWQNGDGTISDAPPEGAFYNQMIARQDQYTVATNGTADGNMLTADKNALTAALQATAQGAYNGAGALSGVQVEVTNQPSMQFCGTNGYHVGDILTVSASGVTFTGPVSEVELTWNKDGFTVKPTLGTITSDPSLQSARAVSTLASRLRRTSSGK